ncbi:uncharacterized protein AB9W97_019749 [Spinachia spinachia]
MSKVQMLRYLVKQRLAEAAEEIFGLFERTIAEYEEDASRLKEDNERLAKRLHAVFNPEVRIQRAGWFAHSSHLHPSTQYGPDLQQRFMLNKKQQKEPAPTNIKEEQEPTHIKEEQEDPDIKEKPLHGLEEDDLKVSFIPVKSEEDEAESSHLHQRHTKGDGQDCRGLEPDRNSGPSEPGTDEKTGDSSETEDSDVWNKTREPQLVFNTRNNDDGSDSDSRCRTSEKPLICSKCKKTFGSINKLKRHMMTHLSVKPFSCSECAKSFTENGKLKTHIRSHTGEKPFSCPQCAKSFTENGKLKTHMRSHSGEKPFSCPQCAKSFTENGTLKMHMRCHTGEKPFRCLECSKRFTRSGHLKTHMRCHTGEKPFSCSECGTRFTRSGHLKTHMRCHTGEKPFRCLDCSECFSRRGHLKTHMRFHTGEKPFSCSECAKRFTLSWHLKRHMRCHKREKPLVSHSVVNVSL